MKTIPTICSVLSLNVLSIFGMFKENYYFRPKKVPAKMFEFTFRSNSPPNLGERKNKMVSEIRKIEEKLKYLKLASPTTPSVKLKRRDQSSQYIQSREHSLAS